MKNVIIDEYIPKRQTKGSAGYDIYAIEDMTITDSFRVFDTGVVFDGSENPRCNNLYNLSDIYFKQWVGLIFPRSSYGFKHGLQFANTVCVIDRDYRDTIKISMKARETFRINKGSRFAQIIFMPVGVLDNEVEPTATRDGGIGSTDKKCKTLDDYKE